MNGFEKTTAQFARQLARGTLIAAVLVVGASSPVKANAIQTEWNNFLAGGKTEWETKAPPPITLRIKKEIAAALFEAEKSSNPLSIPFIPYLEWRRDLNPTRFDRYHPVEGPIIAKLPTKPTINPQPQLTNTPEPGTLTLAVALSGAGVWWRRGRRARPFEG